ncbi:MAG: hypothetical protein V7603_5295 [Micromonosporaceae bacterium]
MRESWDREYRPLPGRDAGEFAWLLLRQDGVLTRRQAVLHLGRSVVRNHLARRRWRLCGRAVMVTHNGPLTPGQRLWAAVLSAGPDALCAGSTAAALEGLKGYESRQIHLVVRGGPRLAEPPIVIHRTTVLPASHVRDRAAPPRTHIARSVVDAAAWAQNDADARAIVAAAFQQRRVLAPELDTVLSALPKVRRRGLIVETARYAQAGAHSVTEVEFARLCRRFRLPAPHRQVTRRDNSGRIRYLDGQWPDYRLRVEVDGAWHLDVRTWWADMRRHNDLWVAGEQVLRFPAWAIRHQPDTVAHQLRAALFAGGWRP